jgi:hypothetical protein
MNSIFQNVANSLGNNTQDLIIALLTIVFGWLLAFVLSYFFKRILLRINLNEKANRWLGEREEGKQFDIENWISQGVYYLTILIVLIFFLKTLNIQAVNDPINRMLASMLEHGPRFIVAGIILLFAWLLASILKLIVSQILKASKVDEKLSDQVGLKKEEMIPMAQTVGDAIYWLIILLFLPAVLNALQLKELLTPVEDMTKQILNFLPNLFAAVLIMAVGWLIARIIQRVVSNLLSAMGADRLSDSIGLAPVLGKQRLSGLLGLVVYIFVMIPVLVASLKSLKMEAITDPASNMLNKFFVSIPQIVAALLVIAIAYIIGRIVTKLLSNLLTAAGFNNIFHKLGIGTKPIEGERTASEIVGHLAMVAVMLFAVTESFRLLNFTALSDLLTQFLVFLGHVIMGIIIFSVGLFLANLAANTIRASHANQSALLAMTARISILVLAGAMALQQMGLANDIINMAFGMLLGSVAVAIALSFGLGGRKIAQREIEVWLTSLRDKKEDEPERVPEKVRE